MSQSVSLGDSLGITRVCCSSRTPFCLVSPSQVGRRSTLSSSHLSLSADIWTHFSWSHQWAQKKTRVQLGPTEAACKINRHICYQDTWDLMATWEAHVLGDSLVNHSAPHPISQPREALRHCTAAPWVLPSGPALGSQTPVQEATAFSTGGQPLPASCPVCDGSTLSSLPSCRSSG